MEIKKSQQLIQRESQKADTSLVTSTLEVNKLQKKANFFLKLLARAKEQFVNDISYLKGQRGNLTTENLTLIAKINSRKGDLQILVDTVNKTKLTINKAYTDLQEYRKQRLDELDIIYQKKVSEIKSGEATLNGREEAVKKKEKEVNDKSQELEGESKDIVFFQELLKREKESQKQERVKLQGEKENIRIIKEEAETKRQDAIKSANDQKTMFDKVEKALLDIENTKTEVNKLRTKLDTEIMVKLKEIKDKEKSFEAKEKELNQKEKWLEDRQRTLTRTFDEARRKNLL